MHEIHAMILLHPIVEIPRSTPFSIPNTSFSQKALASIERVEFSKIELHSTSSMVFAFFQMGT